MSNEFAGRYHAKGRYVFDALDTVIAQAETPAIADHIAHALRSLAAASFPLTFSAIQELPPVSATNCRHCGKLVMFGEAHTCAYSCP